MMQQALLADAIDDEEQICEEFRTARTDLLLPTSLKQKARQIAAQHGASLNEFVVRALEAGLANEAVLKQLAEAAQARRRRRRLNKLKQLKEAANRAA